MAIIDKTANAVLIIRTAMAPDVYCCLIKNETTENIRDLLNRKYNSIIQAIKLVMFGEIFSLEELEKSKSNSINNSIRISSLDAAKKNFNDIPEKYFLDLTLIDFGWRKV